MQACSMHLYMNACDVNMYAMFPIHKASYNYYTLALSFQGFISFQCCNLIVGVLLVGFCFCCVVRRGDLPYHYHLVLVQWWW